MKLNICMQIALIISWYA